MTFTNCRLRSRAVFALAAISFGGVAVTARYLQAQAASDSEKAHAASFEQIVKPFFTRHCMTCHSSDVGTAGIRVDQLDAKFEDRHIQTWQAVRERVRNGSMPPRGLPRPTAEERDRVVEWIGRNLEIARVRPAPKNGLVRRPNMDLGDQMTNLILAQRAYQLNLAVVDRARESYQQALNINGR